MTNNILMNESKQVEQSKFDAEGKESGDSLPRTRKSRSPEKARSMPDLNPRLKFHMAMNLMGEKTAHEYLEWVFMDKKTGKLPSGSEEQINRILDRVLVRKRDEQGESPAEWKRGA